MFYCGLVLFVCVEWPWRFVMTWSKMGAGARSTRAAQKLSMGPAAPIAAWTMKSRFDDFQSLAGIEGPLKKINIYIRLYKL